MRYLTLVAAAFQNFHGFSGEKLRITQLDHREVTVNTQVCELMLLAVKLIPINFFVKPGKMACLTIQYTLIK